MLSQSDIEAFNILGEFCGQRDIPELTATSLQQNYGISQSDVFVLFGGSILYGVDVLAKAIQNKIAKKYIIVGGFGHTTATLQQTVAKQYPDIATSQMQEADIFAALLKKRFNLQVDYLETESTNCGNNITYMLDLLKNEQVNFQSIILAQDATMQKRMSACLKKYVVADVQIINFATYQNQLIIKNQKVSFAKEIPGMWAPERYMKLLMGEIPRLTDDVNGYGPRGKNYISHVNIPKKVQDAYLFLNDKYPEINRPSNNLYSS
ncbi:ElyC/SanA/YdcF family protein [Companilactobacillus huachuanensis]|uniref:ElyC/SanA/YdcF family protein n=1 Tax=Companilactobacillus huachuanensis TaxID=2559914 RepID=A0ABW1RQS2_9LACO|nr:ElyC/SanA/YdcF family protein [Companilactobacillus huachuanensis]